MVTLKFNEFRYLFAENQYVVISNLLDLEGNGYTIPSGCTIEVNGGGFINSGANKTINLNGAKVKGDVNNLIHTSNNGGIVLTGFSEGSYKWDGANHKPLWWDGTQWVDATGTEV